MDKEQARFILDSFRPDGADAGDPGFAEALQLAMQDRELGEWLAGERAFDASFAAALGTVELPNHLRDDIIAHLAAVRGDFPEATDALDSALVATFAGLRPPAGLRGRVLGAMDRTVAPPAPPKTRFLRRFSIPLAAAAGIAVALIVTRQPPETVARLSGVPIETVRAGFVRTIESPSFALDMKQEDPQILVRHLRDKRLPCPGTLPAGLARHASLGCRELDVDGRRGSILCFNLGADGLAHLVIFRRADVQGDIPSKSSREIVRNGGWSSVRWADGDRVYLLISRVSPDRLAGLL